MGKKIGLVHATLNAVQPMNDAFKQYAPEVAVTNFLDEGLIAQVNEQGIVTPDLVRRLVKLIEKAEDSGVDGVLLTCSTFTPFADRLQFLFNVPVVSADYSMLEQAVETGSRIGVIATVVAAGPVTEQILREIAERDNKEIQLFTEIIPEAFQALQQGEVERHDALIHEKVKKLSQDCDVVLLAQMSMARAQRSYPEPLPMPLMTSPEISIKTLLSIVC